VWLATHNKASCSSPSPAQVEAFYLQMIHQWHHSCGMPLRAHWQTRSLRRIPIGHASGGRKMLGPQLCRFLDGRQRGHHTRRGSRRPKSANAGNRGATAGRAAGYGDFAGGSGVRVVFAVGDAADFAARVGYGPKGDRVMGGLRGAVVVTLGIVARTSAVTR